MLQNCTEHSVPFLFVEYNDTLRTRVYVKGIHLRAIALLHVVVCTVTNPYASDRSKVWTVWLAIDARGNLVVVMSRFFPRKYFGN